MVGAVGAFFSLYLATLMLLMGSGLFNTYIGLRLSDVGISEVWVGGLIAAYYLGLVFGARIGHRLIIGVGHIRAYAASAAVVTVCVLIQVMVDNMWVWLALRFVAGAGMVSQFMGIESWLNQQTENNKRGTVFAFYMLVSSLGTVLGQLTVTLFPTMNYQPLVFVAICSVASLIPVAVTRRMHPALQVPAPINARYYVERVPMSMTVLFVAGMITGAFYGLAPVYGVRVNLSSDQVAVFVAAAVAAGVVAQWPIGWLADRFDRVKMIRINAAFIFLLAIPLWGWLEVPFAVLLVFSALFGILQFTLYPLGAAFANDNVDLERRVGLSAILYMVYGVGACIGPLIVGLLMNYFGSALFYIFVACCGAALVVLVRPQKVSGDHLSADAPTEFVPMPDTLPSATATATLDPRVDISSDISHDPVTEEEYLHSEPELEPEASTDEAIYKSLVADTEDSPPASDNLAGDQRDNRSNGQGNT